MTGGRIRRILRFRMRERSDHRLTAALIAGLCALLLLKYFWTMLWFQVPLGYDAGIYRYLFVRHGEGFPPFVLGHVEPWAKGHPLGLFFFSTILIRLGMPVDWLVGWIWNLVPVALACSLAWIAGRKWGKSVGILTLVMAVLSLSQFYGFIAMYWKTELSLLFGVWAFYLLERRSWIAAPLLMLALATHHQTGLLLGMTVLAHLLSGLIGGGKSADRRQTVFLLLAGAAACLVALLWYVPIWDQAVSVNLRALLARASDGTSGSFPAPSLFLRFSGPELLLAAAGFVLSFRRERGTLWQWAALWPLLFVLLHLFFYKRFFLQLEFFLLPFAALGAHALWQKRGAGRAALSVLLVLQMILSLAAMLPGRAGCTILPFLCDAQSPPSIDVPVTADVLQDIRRIGDALPRGAKVLALEPVTAPWVQGWMPYQIIAGPGIFAAPPWDAAVWQKLILGTAEERSALFAQLEKPLYLYTSDLFWNYYGETAGSLRTDPCVQPTAFAHLWMVACPPGGA